MAYQSWSVVFGEQPAASKWNILGTNDSSFNDGTGIGTNAIAAASLATNAISLGYASITSNFVLSSAQTTPTQITGLTASVTIPAGSRKIRITGYCGVITLAAGTGIMTIWDGVVNSGTQLGQVNIPSSGAGATVIAIVTPSAGSKTYNLGIQNTGLNNTTIGAAATQPAFILVEAI